MKALLCATLALLLYTATAGAAVVTAPSVSCAPGTQLNLPISMAGPEIVTGVTFSIAITGGTISDLVFPYFRVLEYPFDGDAVIYTDSDGYSAAYADWRFTSPQGPGVLARLLIDTTGLTPGLYEIRLANSDMGPTTLYSGELGIITELVNGTLEITPEPAALALLALGGLLIRRRRA